MSVVRFTLQTPSLPVFIPTVLLGQSDPNKLVYAVTLEYNYTSPVGSNVPNFSGSFTQNLIFVSPDKTQPTPAPPLVSQDFSSTYYYLYSYTQWVAMINTAFAIAFGDGSTTTTAGLTGLFNAWKTTNNTAITAWNATHTGATSIPTQLLISYPLMEFKATSVLQMYILMRLCIIYTTIFSGQKQQQTSFSCLWMILMPLIYLLIRMQQLL